MLNIADCIVIVTCRTAIFLYHNICTRVMFDTVYCSCTSISFSTRMNTGWANIVSIN